MSITFVHLSFHTILQLNYKMHSLNICVTSAQLGYSATIPQSIFTILCQDVEVQNPLTLTRGQSWSLVKTAFWREYTETPFSSAPPGCESSNWILSPESGYAANFFDGITMPANVANAAKLQLPRRVLRRKNENSEMQFAVILL